MSKKTKNTVLNTLKNRWAEKSAESSEDGDNDANLLYPDLTEQLLQRESLSFVFWSLHVQIIKVFHPNPNPNEITW